MTKLIGIVISLLLVTVLHSAEIVAWKVPLSRFTWKTLQDDGIARCEKAPEASPFFNESDELWDLSAIEHANDHSLKLEWLIWNATSGRVVAKGDWAQISAMHTILRTYDMPRQCRVTLRSYPVVDPSQAFAATTKPLAEHSHLARSGRKAETSGKTGNHSFTLYSETTIGEKGHWVDLRLSAFIGDSKQAPLHIKTAFTLHSGQSLWIARDFDGTQGIDLTVTAAVEFLDGTPIHERVMIQNGVNSQSLFDNPELPNPEPVRIGESGWFTQAHIDPLSLAGILDPKASDPDVDPFAEPDVAKRVRLPKVPSTSPPAFLKPWLDHEVLDAHEWLEKFAPGKWTDEDFIGYDSIRERLYFFSPDQKRTEDFSNLFFTLDGGRRSSEIFVTLEGLGQTCILARSGHKASVSRGDGDKHTTRDFEVEPTLGESGDLIDLRFFFEKKSDPARSIKINNAAILQTGEWSEIATSRVANAESTQLRVKAEVILQD